MMPSLSTAFWAGPTALPAGALCLTELEARLFDKASSSSSSSSSSGGGNTGTSNRLG
jgi:hypothetical protein